MFYTVRYLLCKMLHNVCINRFSEEKYDQLLQLGLFSTAGERETRGGEGHGHHLPHVERYSWRARGCGDTYVAALQCPKYLGNAHAAFGLGQ